MQPLPLCWDEISWRRLGSGGTVVRASANSARRRTNSASIAATGTVGGKGTEAATLASNRASRARPSSNRACSDSRSESNFTNRFSARSMKLLQSAICSDTGFSVGGNFGFDKGFLDWSPPWHDAVLPEAPLWLRILRDSTNSEQSRDCAPYSNLPGKNSSTVLAGCLNHPEDPSVRACRTCLWATLPTSDGGLESPGPNPLELASCSILGVP